MAWKQFAVEDYKIYGVAYNTKGYPNIYGFIRLYWQEKQRATLWFYRDGTESISSNASFQSGGYTNYYGRFGQSQFADFVDILRNEKPVYFHWNDVTKGVFLATGKEPVGEEETDLP
ncbi:hypothetical protein KAR91_77710 [Candidatus Pacearchaeota archaeon]|nr:hypothetical protein [Candidatus Pacearchaeota archaeon]